MTPDIYTGETRGKKRNQYVILLILSAVLAVFHLRVDMAAWSVDCVTRGGFLPLLRFSVVLSHTIVSIMLLLLLAIRSGIVAYGILPFVLFCWVVPTYLHIAVGPCAYSELVTGLLGTNWRELSGLLSLPVCVMLLLLAVGGGLLIYSLRTFFSGLGWGDSSWRVWAAWGYIGISTAVVPLVAMVAPQVMVPLLFGPVAGNAHEKAWQEENLVATMLNETCPAYVYRVLLPYYRQVAFVYYVVDYYRVKDVVKSEELVSELMSEEDVVVVLVIGESYRSDHASWNGYARETLPQLSTLKGNVVNFPWFKSYATSTVSSIYGMLSDATCQSREAKHTSFLGVMQKHGFSNKLILCRTTQWERNPQINVILDKKLEELVICGDTDEMAAQMEKVAAAGGRQIIIVEDGTGHAPYEHETEFARFGEEVIDKFDNCLLQTDDVLFRLINKLKNKKAVLVYSSDHGQSFGEQGCYMHGGALSVEKQRHVFSFVWYSDRYAAAHPDKVAAMRANACKPLSHDDLYLSILSLAGIRCNLPTQNCGDFTMLLPRPEVKEFELGNE